MSTPKASYRITKPEPVQLVPGESKQQLTITIENRTSSTITCSDLTITLPAGDGETDLVPTNAAEFVGVRLPLKWKRLASPKPPVFTVKPDPLKQGQIPGHKSIQVTLHTISVNGQAGSAIVDVKGTIDGVTVSDSLPVAKFSGGFVFGNFKPDRMATTPYQDVTVSWTCEKRQPGQTLTLRWTGSADIDVSTDHAKMVSIQRDSAFDLTVTEKTKNGQVTASMRTFVTVSQPHLAVQNLTVLGDTELLLEPHVRVPLAPEPIVTERTDTYTAETDGLLFGSVQTFSATATADLTVEVTPAEGSSHTTRVRAVGGHDELFEPGPPIAVAVPAGSKVKISWSLKDTQPVPDIQAFATELQWQPIGVGTLVRSS